jgi:hypothetical protein
MTCGCQTYQPVGGECLPIDGNSKANLVIIEPIRLSVELAIGKEKKTI